MIWLTYIEPRAGKRIEEIKTHLKKLEAQIKQAEADNVRPDLVEDLRWLLGYIKFIKETLGKKSNGLD